MILRLTTLVAASSLRQQQPSRSEPLSVGAQMKSPGTDDLADQEADPLRRPPR